MAYQTGTVASLDALFTTLDTFLTGSAGWTLVDTVANTVGSRDKVYSSPGSVANRAPAVIRLMTPKYVGSAAQPQLRDYVKWNMPGLTAMGYRSWQIGAAASAAASPDVTKAIGEYGIIKEWRALDRAQAAVMTILGFTGSNQVPGGSKYTTTSSYYNIWNSNSNVSTTFRQYWLGRRIIATRADNGNANNFAPLNINDSTVYTTWGNVGNFVTNNPRGSIPVVDKTTGVEYMYFMSQNGVVGQAFWKLNLATAAFTALADPPWGAVGIVHQNSQVLWDGDDTIYVVRGDSTTSFAKYSISGNTWVTLANLPVTAAGGTTAATVTQVKPFIWKASNHPADVGAEDVLFFSFANTMPWYQYKVTSATWSNGTTFPHPSALPAVDSLLATDFDGDYMWARISNNTNSLDQSAPVVYTPNYGAAGTWSKETGTVAFTNASAAVVGTGTHFTTNLAVGQTVSPAGGASGSSWIISSITDDTHLTLTANYTGTTISGVSLAVWYPTRFFSTAGNAGTLDFYCAPTGFLPCPSAAGAYTYWMIANSDQITVVIKIPAGTGQSPNYWWIHLGYLDSPWVTDSRSIVGATNPGFGVSITVNSPNPNWVPGDKVMLFDTASTNTEPATISSVSGTTVVLQQVINSYASGAFIGKDPHPVVITSNARWATTSSSATRYHGGGLYDWYRCQPYPVSTAQPDWLLTPTNRSGYRLWPFEIVNEEANYPDTYEWRGKLKTVYATKTGLNNEDILQIGSGQYLAIVADYYSRSLGNESNRITLIGPLA